MIIFMRFVFFRTIATIIVGIMDRFNFVLIFGKLVVFLVGFFSFFPLLSSASTSSARVPVIVVVVLEVLESRSGILSFLVRLARLCLGEDT